MFRLNIPRATKYPYCITFRDSPHKQHLLKDGIEFNLCLTILVQGPTQCATDIPEISPGSKRDITLRVYSVKITKSLTVSTELG
jgi:hypothetical protein